MIPAKLQERLDDLAFFTDRADRVEALIAIADEYVHAGPNELPRVEGRKVPGCESEVFFDFKPVDGDRLWFRFTVDNPQGISAMALAVMLQEGASGCPANEILAIDDDVVFTIFGRELSMGKSLGLTGMVRMVKTAAQTVAQKSEKSIEPTS